MSAIFGTPHGSHLYGLAHERSDRDYYFVYSNDHVFANGEEGQRIYSYGDRPEDYVRVRLEKFLGLLRKGVPQAVEALFSRQKEWYSPEWQPMLEGIRITSGEQFHTYERTIRSFAQGDEKRRTHAARLYCNLRELRGTGRLASSRLTPEQIAYVRHMGKHYTAAELLARFDIPATTR